MEGGARERREGRFERRIQGMKDGRFSDEVGLVFLEEKRVEA